MMLFALLDVHGYEDPKGAFLPTDRSHCLIKEKLNYIIIESI